MVWEYIEGDRHELSHLKSVLKLYENLYMSKFEDWERAMSYEKYGLPNWRTEVLKREMALEDVIKSMININEAISEHEAS